MLTPDEIELAVDALRMSAARYRLMAGQPLTKGRTEAMRRGGIDWAERYAKRAEAVINKLNEHLTSR